MPPIDLVRMVKMGENVAAPHTGPGDRQPRAPQTPRGELATRPWFWTRSPRTSLAAPPTL